jgi:hypothetical protein
MRQAMHARLTGLRHGARVPAAALTAALVAVAIGARAATAVAPEVLADDDAKAEFSYLSEDRRALDRLLAELRPLRESERAEELYLYAHVEFRRQQLAFGARAMREAETAGEACLEALDRREAHAARDAEGLVLAAACAGYLAEHGGIKHLSAGRRRDASLEAAKALAPANPRVLLLAATVGWFQATSAAERRALRPLCQRSAEAFDAVVATPPGAPTWGGAEAWLFVGRGLEEDGNLVGARSAYERALLVAPDFAAAKRHLARLSGRG